MNFTVKTFIIAIILLVVTAVVIFLVSRTQAPAEPTIPTENQQVKQNNPLNVEPEMPGNVINPVSEYKDLIRVEIDNQQAINSPLEIKGEARGQWYFEATFPVRIEDEQGVIWQGFAQADGDWMTTNYVPFTIKAEFSEPRSNTGVIIFEKQNASGLPEHTDELRIPIKF